MGPQWVLCEACAPLQRVPSGVGKVRAVLRCAAEVAERTECRVRQSGAYGQWRPIGAARGHTRVLYSAW